jgi:hypothetical protein
MNAFICKTCGSQFSETAEPPDACPICDDERQYIGHDGQQWTTMEKLRAGHRNRIEPEEGVIGIHTEPHVAIGQRALLIESPRGNILWDCVALLDDETVERITRLGGIAAIALSHPHYYTTMVEWSRAFGDAPIWLHTADREWVMRPDKRIHFWKNDTHTLAEGFTLIRCGGHFEGGTVLHRAAGADEPGELFSSDIIAVCADRRHVTFMRSYPNYIPLNHPAIEHIIAALEPFEFDRIYGAFRRDVIRVEGKTVVRFSAERYLRAIGG